MMSSIFKKILPILILSIVIILVFTDLTKTFYQQDEWYGLGLTIAKGVNSTFSGVSSPLDFLFVKGRIFSNLIYYLFASNFPLQNVQMATFAIALHMAATFLVFVLIKRFIQNSIFALIGALFFAVNAVSHQAVTWPFISMSVITSSILVLIGITFFLRYLRNLQTKWLFLAEVMIYISLWFKETGLYMFLFLPLVALLFKKYSVSSFFRTFWISILAFLLITGYRVMELKLRTTTSNLYITGLNENFFPMILLRMIFYPLTSFSLMFVPGDYFLSFARFVMILVYPFLSYAGNNLLIAQTVVLDLLAVILTVLLLLSIYIFLRKERLFQRKIVIFWLSFSFAGFLPYVLLSKDFSYLEPRYYYLSVVGGAFLLSWFLKRLWEIFGSRIFYLIVLPLCIFYLMFHASVVHSAIIEQVRLSNLRQDFIMQLKTLVPTLDNKKNIFYITSDLNYWDDGNKIPFQQGSGYTIMVLFYESGRIPKEFLQAQGSSGEGFLFGIGSQGYMEKDGYGFGYFWDEELLNETINKYNLTANSVIKLQYNSKERELIKIRDD